MTTPYERGEGTSGGVMCDCCEADPPTLPFREVWEGSQGQRVWLCRDCAKVIFLRIGRGWPVGLWPEGELTYVDRHYCAWHSDDWLEECGVILVGGTRWCEAHKPGSRS
jgi:hypothetical protein